MVYHITYRKRDGNIEVTRIGATSRAQAISNAAATLYVPRSAILSAVGCPTPKR
jgi:hypothetical protein